MRALRHRQPSQVMALAAVSMISIVSMIAFVIDASTFFVVRRELQNAADAGALAGAMFLSPDAPAPTADQIGDCTNTDHPTAPVTANPAAVLVACHYARINLGQASRLCNTKADVPSDPDESRPYTRLDPGGGGYTVVSVQVSCDAQYTFGRIINLHERPISAYAIGALGTWVFSPPFPQAEFHGWSSCAGLSTCRDASRLLPD